MFPLYRRLGLTKDEFRIELTRLIEADASLPTLAIRYGVSAAAIHQWCVKFEIRRRSNLRNPLWLKQKYEVERLPQSKIAELCGVTYQAVGWHLRRAGIVVRSFREAQRNRNRAMEKPNVLHGLDYIDSFGYCFYFKGHFVYSVPEYIFLRETLKTSQSIKSQPFVFRNKRPDFLISDEVIEVKDRRKDISDNEYDEYVEWGKIMTATLGYRYRIEFIGDTNHTEVLRIRRALRCLGATPGIIFTLLEEI